MPFTTRPVGPASRFTCSSSIHFGDHANAIRNRVSQVAARVRVEDAILALVVTVQGDLDFLTRCRSLPDPADGVVWGRLRRAAAVSSCFVSRGPEARTIRLPGADSLIRLRKKRALPLTLMATT